MFASSAPLHTLISLPGAKGTPCSSGRSAPPVGPRAASLRPGAGSGSVHCSAATRTSLWPT
jgi:hypothetical protein